MTEKPWDTDFIEFQKNQVIMSLQTKLLTTSFELLKAQQQEFSDCFYQNLFSDYLQVQPLFAHTDMKEQPKKLFASLVLVVNNLTKPDALVPVLKGLRTRHIKYGALPEHHPAVGSTLLKAMSISLGESWTEDLTQARADAYVAIVEIMLDGADYPAEILDSNSIKT